MFAAVEGDNILLFVAVAEVVIFTLVVPRIEVCVFFRMSNWGCHRNRTRTCPLTPAIPSKGILTCRATKLSTKSPRMDIPPEPRGISPRN